MARTSNTTGGTTASASPTAHAYEQRDPLTVLLVTRGDVFPPDHGAAAKIVRIARVLARRGHRVYLASNDRDRYVAIHRGGETSHDYPTALRTISQPKIERLRQLVRSIGVPDDDHFLFSPLFDPAYAARVAWLAHATSADVLQAEFPGYAGPVFAAHLTRPRTRTLLVEHNVEFERIKASAFGLNARAANVLRALELAATALVQEIVVCSDDDRRLLSAAGVEERRLHVIPHGVDLDSYENAATPAARAAARARFGFRDDDFVLVFHGVLSYAPNREAVDILRTTIVPKLRSRGFSPRVLVCGRYAPQIDDPAFVLPGSILHLADALPAADVATVPLLGGGGTRLKILEYFAAQVPCVSTPKGAEGIRVEHGREIMLASSWEAFVDHIITLMRDRDEATALARRARVFVEQFSWDSVATMYERLYLAKPTPTRLVEHLNACRATVQLAREVVVSTR